jgi:hypothetical protein
MLKYLVLNMHTIEIYYGTYMNFYDVYTGMGVTAKNTSHDKFTQKLWKHRFGKGLLRKVTIYLRAWKKNNKNDIIYHKNSILGKQLHMLKVHTWYIWYLLYYFKNCVEDYTHHKLSR